jgi:hypothetical protein
MSFNKMAAGRSIGNLTASTKPNSMPHPIGVMPTQISGHGPVVRDPNNFFALSI